ncbi:MAG: helix-hairpin-helix domain-containing protein [Oscillospiraceae bacterium]|jgi:comEA protein|nr:helix-hairpin-helix domain-containing protein [Oscillospiraceae bacterium]
MRTRKAELSVIIITVAFVCFVGGFFVGRMGAPGNIVPAEPPEISDTESGGASTSAPSPTPEPEATGPAEPTASADTEHDAQGRVNINTASADTLQELRGIGPSLSARIIEYREQNGAFTYIEELLEVTGIGNAKFADIKDHITLG